MSKNIVIVAWCTNESDRRMAEELIAATGDDARSLLLMRDSERLSLHSAKNCSPATATFPSVAGAWQWVRENLPDQGTFIEAKFNKATLPEGAPADFIAKCLATDTVTDMVSNFICYTDAYLSYSPHGHGAAEIKDDFRFIGPSKDEISFFLRQAEEEQREAPGIICLDLFPQCNKRCPKCLFHAPESPFRVHIPPQEHMPFDMALELIRQAAEFTPKPVIAPTFSGEPLCYPRILELLGEAKRLGLPVSVTTNALRLTPDVTKELIDIGVDTIMISLDAATEETYQKLQPPGKLSKVVANIRALLATRQNGTPLVGLTFIAEDDNESEFEGFLEEWKDADYIIKSHKLDMVNCGNPINPRNTEAPKNAPCSTSLGGMYIRHDGRIALCGYDLRSDNVGLAAGGDMSLKDIWTSDTMRAWRNKMLTPPYGYAFCKLCACREGQYMWNSSEAGTDITISPITKTYKR